MNGFVFVANSSLVSVSYDSGFVYLKGWKGGFFTGFSKKKAYNGTLRALAIFLKNEMLIVCSTLVASMLAIIEALVPDNSARRS